MSKRELFYMDNDFKLSYEILNGCLFVHAEFNTFTKEIMGKLRKVWTDFRTVSYFDGWEDIYTYTQDPRIVKLIGDATELETPHQLKKRNIRMFKWELK